MQSMVTGTSVHMDNMGKDALIKLYMQYIPITIESNYRCDDHIDNRSAMFYDTGDNAFGQIGIFKGVAVEVLPCFLVRAVLTRQDLIDLKLVSSIQTSLIQIIVIDNLY